MARLVVTVVTVVSVVLMFASAAEAAGRPRYEVPAGFTRCPHAVAWNGFFKWASERDTNCRVVRRFMRVYAAHASGPHMPRHVAGYHCQIRYWHNEDGDIYASRHACRRGRVSIRFYGMA